MDNHALGRLLVSSETYRTYENYHKLFSQLRAEQPVALASPEGYRPFWAVTKYADIRTVELQQDKFTNAERSFLISSLDEERLAAAQKAGLTAMGRSIVQLDGREHRALRNITQSWFAPSSVKRLETQIRQIAKESVDHMVELGGQCDFVKDVAVWYPLRVILSILGIPREDEAALLKMTQEMFAPNDPDTNTEGGVAGMIAASQAIRDYFETVTRDRRQTPRDDVSTVIANATVDGAPISELDATGYYVTIITAGHDTTSSTTAGGLLALIQHPEQRQKLLSKEASIDGAVAEFLRWVTPIKHFFRTAQENYKLRGQKISAGDSLMMCYPSGNRDEEAFEDPFAFKVDRAPNQQIAFGYGAHVCLGQHLGKMEMRIFFDELLARISDFSLTGDAVLYETNFIQGLKTLPISYNIF